MQKVLLGIVAYLFCLPLLAQVTDPRPIYNYEETRHELAIDLVPIFGGNLPSSLFYRKNYINSNEKLVGLRIGLVAGNQFKSVDHIFDNRNFSKEAIFNYFLSVGKEWQKPISHNFIAYSGADVGAGLNIQRFYGVTESLMPGGIQSYKNQRINYNVTGFWGIKYHIMPRLSLFAEMGVCLNYSDKSTSIRRNYLNASSERIDSYNSFTVNLLPLRSLNLSYHF